MKFILLILSATAGLQAQAPGAQPEISKAILAIAANADRLMPMMEQIKPGDWVAKGASETYVAQWKTSEEQCARRWCPMRGR